MPLLSYRIIGLPYYVSFASDKEHGGNPPPKGQDPARPGGPQPPKGDYPVYRMAPEQDNFFDPQQTLLEYNARIENEKMRRKHEEDAQNHDKPFIDVHYPDQQVIVGLPHRDGADGLRRIWGGETPERGSYAYPASSPEDSPESLALPPGNTGKMISNVETKKWDALNPPSPYMLVYRSVSIEGGVQYKAGMDPTQEESLFTFNNPRKRDDEKCSLKCSL